MSSIKEIKKNAKKSLKKNYWRCVAVSFFVSLMIGTLKYNFQTLKNTIPLPNIAITSPLLTSINLQIINETITKVTNITNIFTNYKPTRGILANIFNSVTNSSSFIFGLLNSLNQLIFHDRLWASIIIFLGAILSFIYWFLVRNTLIVAKARFFLENRNYTKTNFKRMLLPFRIKKLKKITFTMFLKSVLNALWYLTIVGGFIKHYSYYLVPYILAENPEISGKNAILLSKQMMDGYKWKLFKIDLSLIGWKILDFVSFHLIGIIYAIPYEATIKAEYYMQVRILAKENRLLNADSLKDDLLEKNGLLYPANAYLYKETSHKWLNTDYNKKYSFTSLVLMFFTASIIGWLWEVGLHLFQFGSFVNRGTLHGPWLHIYGWGLLAVLIILKKFRNNPVLTFILSMGLSGIIEYGTSWYLETFKQARWWDYDGFFLNLNGRICLEGLLVFGIGSCAFIYFIAPFLDSIFSKIKPKIKVIICIVLSVLYLTDLLYSSKYPNTGVGISEPIKAEENISN